MHQPDRSEKRNVRHSPYERIVLPDSVRRDLVKYGKLGLPIVYSRVLSSSLSQ